MNPEKLTQLVYTSAATCEFSPPELQAMLRVVREKNARQSVTGMLLYTPGSFFQVLEGEEERLTELFATICSDPRHTSVTKITQEPVAHRSFGSWTMGYWEVEPKDLAEIEDLGDFFRKGNSFVTLGSGRAKKLLSAFA